MARAAINNDYLTENISSVMFFSVELKGYIYIKMLTKNSAWPTIYAIYYQQQISII